MANEFPLHSNYPKLEGMYVTATFGRSPLYTAAWKNEVGEYHKTGRVWPAERLQTFFREGLLTYYIGMLAGFELDYENKNNNRKAKVESEPFFPTGEFIARSRINGIWGVIDFANLCLPKGKQTLYDLKRAAGPSQPNISQAIVAEQLQPWVGTMRDLWNKSLDSALYLLEMGGEFQRLKQASEFLEKDYELLTAGVVGSVKSKLSMSELGQQIMTNENEMNILQTACYWYVLDLAQQIKQFIASKDFNIQNVQSAISAFNPSEPSFIDEVKLAISRLALSAEKENQPPNKKQEPIKKVEINQKNLEKFKACEKALNDFIKTPIYKSKLPLLFQSSADQDLIQAKTYRDLFEVKTPLAKLAVMQALLNTKTPGLSRAIVLSMGHFSNNEKADLNAAKDELTQLINDECKLKGISLDEFAIYPALITKKLNVDTQKSPFTDFYRWDSQIKDSYAEKQSPSQAISTSSQENRPAQESIKVEGKVAEFEFRGQHSYAPIQGARSCTSISLATAARLLRMDTEEFFNTFNPDMKTFKEKQNANDVLTGCVLAGYDLNTAISGSYFDVVSRKDVTDVMSKISNLEDNIGGIKELSLLDERQIRIHDSEQAKEIFPANLKDFRNELMSDTTKSKPENICFIATAAGHTTAFFSRKDKNGKEFFFVSDARNTLLGGKLEVFNSFDSAYERMLEKWKSHKQDYVSISAFTTKALLQKENVYTNEISSTRKKM